MAKASIITIGDELLIGQVIDTNSAFIAQELNKAGIPVLRRVAVGDDYDAIWNALDEESGRAEIILITGGLGPTADDITKPLLCKYFGGTMTVNEAARQNVIDIFTRLNRPLIERNLAQAEVPDCCTVIQNKRGTAPGMWFEKDGKVFISMPGVPNEMKGMIEHDVISMLKEKFQTGRIIHKTLLTAGIGESMIAEHIKDFEEKLPPNLRLAYLPNYGMVRLRLTATGSDQAEMEVDKEFEKLQSLVKEWMVTNLDEPLEKVLGKILLSKGKTMSTAESCTGGYIAHLITSIPGSSKYYKGSVVSYSNSMKEDVLKVNEATLKKHGAVSEEVVREMLTGILNATHTDYGIAVSGILGPGGGTPEKPVGTVWIAVGGRDNIQTQKMNFRFDRMRNMQMTGMYAMNFLRTLILKSD